MWEIYAYQYADSLFGIFNAAAAIHGSGDYMAAVAAVAFCGGPRSGLSQIRHPSGSATWRHWTRTTRCSRPSGIAPTW